MFGKYLLGLFNRPSNKRSRLVFFFGVAVVTVTLLVIASTLSSRPVISEETELVSSVYTQARASMREEWMAADARLSSTTSHGVLDRAQLLSLFRLRVFVVVAESEVPTLRPLLDSLSEANYTDRVFPIDIEVHVLGSSAAVPPVAWPHGRFDVYAHRLHGNADLSVPQLMADVWQPQSDFELGLPLTAKTRLSPHWHSWVLGAMGQYAATSTETFFKLPVRPATATTPAQRLSPMSALLSGFALGPPVAGAAAKSIVTARAAHPSTVSVFTASFWKAALTRVAAGADQDAVPATWPAFLLAAQSALGSSVPPFLSPPMEKLGMLACDGGLIAECAMPTLDAAQLAQLLRFPSSIDMVPKAS